MRNFFATTIGQILAIVASASAATFGLFLLLLMLLYPHVPPAPPWPWQAAYRVEALVDTLRDVPASDYPALLAAPRAPITEARLLEAPPVCDELTNETRELESVLNEGLSNGNGPATVRVCSGAPAETATQVLVRMGDQTLALRTHRVSRPPPHLTFPFVGALLFLCVGVAAMSTWAVWRVVRPLRRLSDSADAFGRDMAVEPLAEEGPLEIQRAAAAFNRMQQRVTRVLQDRTRMLAAVGHDLRTPLTRMQLSLQAAEPTPVPLHARLLRDIGHMRVMVDSALAYLSATAEVEPREPMDVAALLQSLCDDYADGGADVGYDGVDEAVAPCRPNAIQRAMANLLDNAVQYGTAVRAQAGTDGDYVRITIANDGSVIPADRLDDILEPFVRLDPARNDRPGSVGLGLSIVRDIVADHGGTLDIANRPANDGVVVTVCLPLRAPGAASP
ncbi:HAMP domain-containing protein [Bacillus sp. NP157]|nr:HAMP domain-containing protein [Bacillus sp. NP157]